ncbi:type II secretion system protein GspD [Aestuariivirga litoralis]|uniref:Type II secretion system protein GspD n=1 Tax=Aestuariivirga litoralis TaxID=2650924 RepID=A0A2W2C6D1_9HYPH|nr:type II secretion system protein GspD [Aestuariivirga litoralis]
MLASCQAPSAGLESTNQLDLNARSPAKVTTRGAGPVMKPASQAARYEVFPGASPAAEGDGAEPPAGVGEQADGKFTVNLDGATIAEASKLILGETLGYNYTIDQNLPPSSITMVSNRAVSARQLLDAFEASLRTANAALVKSDGNFRVVMQQAMENDASNLDTGRDVSPGYGVSAIPLRHVGPGTMVNLLDGFMQQLGSAKAWNAGNMILIRGPASQRRALVEVVTNFDVDTMRNQTFGMAALENGRAEEVATQVMKVFAQDNASAGSNGLKVIPVPNINSLIIIANDQAKVRRAITWVRRLDRENLDAPKSYVYAVQNGNAVELAKILSATYGGSAGAGATAEVAPDSPQMDVSLDSGSADQQGQDPSQGDMGGVPQPPQVQPEQQGSDPTSTSSTSQTAAAGGGGGGGGGDAKGIRITPIPANNTLLIRASPRDYREILSTLAQIDQPSTQVLISTTIAEVQLNDTLKYGVQAYFESGNFSFVLTEKTSTAGSVISPKLPGMNLVMGGISNPQLVVDALSKVTNVRIVSSPSLLVMENETATIKVGDQVPIQTQTETTQGGQTVNSYEYRDTGVVLKVKPRVNANGVVMIDLGQELSAVQQDTGIGGQPKFTQRTISSKVSVNDQQTVLLGGLINGTEDRSRVTVPGASQLPLLGRLVGTTGGIATRNEMIVFITPTIVRNGEEASQMSQDLRAKMKNLNFD